MKVSIVKFYLEVTGQKHANLSTALPALERWGVPCDPTHNKRDQVDISFLEAARKQHATEVAAMAERVARRGPRGPRAPDVERMPALPLTVAVSENTQALRDVQAALMLVAEALTARPPRPPLPALEDAAKPKANGDGRVFGRTP